MTWTSIPHGDMAKALNHLHSEVVFNAATTIAQRQSITVDEVEKLLDLIEREVMNVLSCKARLCDGYERAYAQLCDEKEK